MAAFSFQLSGFALLLMTVLSTASAETLVGGLSGDVNVDNTGEATYSIPLSLPPGTAGVVPTLGIAYSSTGGNGILGLGFSLSGLSGVSRSPSTRLHDGVIDSVDFDELDRLVLDGQRLILVSGTAYGVAESEYRTEIESFSKITLHGAMNVANSWFEVRTKSGLIYEYGHTADSFVEPAGRTNALRWAVNKISDTVGNYILFHYSENTNGLHLLTNIAYTGNAGQNLTPCNSINFIYEDRTDDRSGYMAGSKMISDKRLQKIVINGASGYITDYRFTYKYNTNGLSLLTSAQQFFGSDETPKTLFDYTEKTNSATFNYTSGTAFIPDGSVGNVYRDSSPARVDAGDFNGDGIIDFVRLDNSNNPSNSWIAFAKGDGTFHYISGANFITKGSAGNIYRSDKMKVLLPDVNGDGLSDIISIDPYNTSSNSWIGLSTGNTNIFATVNTNLFTYRNGTNFIPCGAFSNVYRDAQTSVISGDFNGDGLADLVSVYPANDQDSQKCWVGLSKGDGTFTFYNGTNFIPESSNTNVFRGSATDVLTGDVNGDGLTDLVSVYPNNDASYSWIGLSKGDGTFNWISDTNFIPNGSADNVFRGDNTKVITGDFNGDGLTDIASVHPNNDASYSWIGLSKGDGTFTYISNTNFIPNGVLGNVYRGASTSVFAADVNGDGLADLVSIYPNNDDSTSWIGISKGNGTFAYINGEDFIPQGAMDGVYRDGSTAVSAGDFNGDGMLDLASVYPGNDASKSWIAFNQNKRCMLSKATKGYRSATEHGPVTEIEYLPITDKLIYTKGTNAIYPVYDIQAPIYVVSALTKDNGIGGKYYSDYTYAEARTHRDRGFLGFRVFESYDNQTHLSQVEILAQDFPQTGSSLRQETYYFPNPANDSTNKQLLKEISNTYIYDRVNHGGTATNNYSIFSYVAKSVEKKWELGEPDTNHTMTKVTSYNWFDGQPLNDIPRLSQTNSFGIILTPGEIEYGNITKIVMDYGDGAKQISSNQYYSVNTSTWLLGRLQASSITHILSGKPSVTRTSSFNYDATSGLLRREIVDPTTLALITDYAYDGFGNITNKTVSAPGIATRSVQQSSYAAGGRFVSASRNILNQGETYQYDQNTGLVKAKTGPNGLTTSMEYDKLGRAIRETRADGTVTTTEYVWLDNTTVSTPDPLNSGSNFTSKVSYRITTQSSGSAPVTVWYDNQGRELRKIGLSPSGKKIYRDIGYNGLGQSVVQSEPYFLDEEIKYTHTEYDVLGRVRYLVSPSGTVMENIYNGLTNRVIADSNHRTTGETPKHQVKTVIQNAKGQTLKVIDNLTNSLIYEYDAIGNLTATKDPYGSRIEMQYDLLGKKTNQLDPDMGKWSYQYNALGELIAQTDANGNRVENAYDTLGRIVARTNWVMTVTNGLQCESTSAWYYDGTDAGCWKGALRREELRDGKGNLTYRKTYAYDSYGRPMLELYNFDNKWYYNCVRYDQYGRVKYTDRFWRPKDVAESGNNLSPRWNVLTTVNTYNSLGAVTKVSDSTGHTWWQIDDQDTDSKGRLLKYTLGNGTVTSKTYDQNTGFLTAITCRNASSENDDIQSQFYDFDRLGNITSRQDIRYFLKETFTNDGLNRLTSSTVEGSTNGPVELTYDNQGNILTKTGVGTYAYGQGGLKPHAVTSVSSGSSVVNYSYDANGNMVARRVGGTNTLTTVWNSFNMVKTMYSGQNGSEFTYDINNNRITQIIEADTGTTNVVIKKKIYIAGIEQDEQVTNPTNAPANWTWTHKETRIFINTPSGTVGIHVQAPGSVSSVPDSIVRKYFHTDHLGSIVAVTGAKVGDRATLLAEYSFDAWGKRRNASDWSPLSQSSIANLQSSLSTDRGFTGHEMLDHLGLIHMNGRIYDANLGRFLSADPTLQFPDNLQDYNRYSYVGNNPLKYTDPSGYGWLSSIGKFFKKYWKTIVIVIIAIVCVAIGLGAFLTGFITNFAGSLLNGGSLSDAFKAGLQGGLTAAITAATGAYIDALNICQLAKELMTGVVGGLISLAKGGTFKDGFLTSVAETQFDSANDPITAAIAGGTVEKIGGGKFANGAVAGATQSLAEAGMNKLSGANAEDPITQECRDLVDRQYKEHSPTETGYIGDTYLLSNGKHAVVSRGTQNWGDWKTNFANAFGFQTEQYAAAAAYAQQQVAKYGRDNVIFVGHSLGGGLASYSAETIGGGARAITFNASGLNFRRIAGRANITAHYTVGEPLSLLQDITPLPGAVGVRTAHYGMPTLGNALGHNNWGQ